MRFGVTPFLSGVLPAGKLRARPKPVGCQAYGLIQVRLKDMPFSYNTINMVLPGVEPRNTSITFIFLPLQVNGKSYNQARLLLGNMGSLHPANRLAAYVTGRLHAPADISHKTSQKSDPTNDINTPGTLHIKAAGTVVPLTITARKTTELKTLTHPPGKMVSQTPTQAHSFKLIAPQWREKSSPREPSNTGSYCRILKPSKEIKLNVLQVCKSNFQQIKPGLSVLARLVMSVGRR